MNIELIVQIVSIITFLAASVNYFVKIGEFKNEVKTLKEDVIENKKEIKHLRDEFDDIKAEHNQSMTEVKTLLIEVKTKIDLMTPLFNMINEYNGRKK